MSIKKIFIENNPDKIIQELVTYAENKLGRTMNPADPERILVDVIAYRETLLRSAMQRLIEGNFVQTAIGEVLDFWGGLFGVIRLSSETDDVYRERILSLNKTNGRGSKYIYLEVVRALDTVSDAEIYTLWEDSTLAPGYIEVYALERVTENGRTYGRGISSYTNTHPIILALQNDAVGIIGDEFFIGNVGEQIINGSISVRRTLASVEQTVRDAVTLVVRNYFDNLSLSLTAEYDAILLANQIRSIDGVASATLNITAPTKEAKKHYTQGTISITITTA